LAFVRERVILSPWRRGEAVKHRLAEGRYFLRCEAAEAKYSAASLETRAMI
jgi:hypothetical protein